MHVLPQTCNRNWGLQRGAAQWPLTSLTWIRLLVQGQHFRHWFAPPSFCTTRACLPDGRGTWAWCLGTLAFLQACWQQRKRQQEQFAASLVSSKRIIQDTVTTRIFPLTHVSPEWAFRTVLLPVLEPVRQPAPQALWSGFSKRRHTPFVAAGPWACLPSRIQMNICRRMSGIPCLCACKWCKWAFVRKRVQQSLKYSKQVSIASLLVTDQSRVL